MLIMHWLEKRVRFTLVQQEVNNAILSLTGVPVVPSLHFLMDGMVITLKITITAIVIVVFYGGTIRCSDALIYF